MELFLQLILFTFTVTTLSTALILTATGARVGGTPGTLPMARYYNRFCTPVLYTVNCIPVLYTCTVLTHGQEWAGQGEERGGYSRQDSGYTGHTDTQQDRFLDQVGLRRENQ